MKGIQSLRRLRVARVCISIAALSLGLVHGAYATSSWTKIAAEGGGFSVSGTATVRYGANSSWVQKSVTGTGQCTTAFFGSDPLTGVAKQCEVANAAPSVSLTTLTGTTNVAPATVALKALASDTDGTVQRVEFYWNGTLKSTATSSPYTWSVSGVPAGSHQFIVKAYDNYGAVTVSAPVVHSVEAPNAAPTITLNTPTAWQTFAAPATIALTVTAADSDGTVARVDYYNGSTLIGSSTTAPFSYTWTNVPASGSGGYTLLAKAIDNKGATGVSATKSIGVVANDAPTVSLTSPTAGAAYTAPASIVISASASDSDGSVARVEFYSGNTLLGTRTTAPFSYTWANVPAGSYSLTARAYDDAGIATTSAARAVTVNATANVAPTVSLTSPAAGAQFTAPATVSIAASAADSDGNVTRVEFYNGSTLLGTSTTAPYSYTWTGVAAGTYSIGARAYDNSGAATSSATLAITINPPANASPTVSLTAPAAGASYTAPASVTLAATASDSDGTVSRVEFYNGSTLLGTSTAAPYTYNWTNVAAGTYSVSARAYDNGGAVTTSASTTVLVNAPGNVAPTVSLTAPTSGAAYSAPATVALTATAADSDGSVTRVEFFNGSTLLGTSTSAPYGYTWTNVPAGSYSLTARAYDNNGAATSSEVRTITVNAANNVAPTVSLTAPAAGSTFNAPASVLITATAADSDGSIARVEFYNGSTLLGTSTAAPYSYTWANVPAGSYSLTARAYDNNGAVALSAAAGIVVNAPANVAPSVSLTAPAAGSSFTAPASITLTATAADTDGTVARVEFYSGGTLLGTSTAAPFTASWTNVAAGTYTLTARAYDNSGASTTSSAVSITVAAPGNVAPTVSLTVPAAGASFTAPASVTLSATAADTDGTVSRVEFYNGSTLLGTSTAAPYAFTWTNVGAGSYSLTARAFDNSGASTTSAARAITVAAAPVQAATTLYFVHTDHLNTPRVIANQGGTTVWRWDNLEPFGATPANEDPDANGSAVVFNLRFAGQYFDRESGVHYNVNRDFDPGTGRYLQADPIGLNGGISLYAYVDGSPLSFVDFLGLAKCAQVTRGEGGRPERATGTVSPAELNTGTGTNASSRAYARSMGNANDDAGHILGRQLGGSGGSDNIFAQAPSVNRGQFAQFENRIAEYVQRTGKTVEIDVKFNYGNGGNRATDLVYDVYQNGQRIFSRAFGN